MYGVTTGTGDGMVDEGMGATERTIANHIKLYSECTHTQPYQDQPLVQFVGWTLAMEETLHMKGWKLQGEK